MSSSRQLALLWGAVVAVLLLAAPLAATVLPGCPLKTISGVPCPACGSGRATLALVDGRLLEAFRWNPGAAAFAVAFALGGLGLGLAAARGIEPPSLPNRLPAWLRWTLLLLLVANWLYVWLIAGL